MSDIQDVVSQSAAQAAPVSAFLPAAPAPGGNAAGSALMPPTDMLSGTSGPDMTAFGAYLANQGNIHANAAPVSENEATQSLSQLFSQPADTTDTADYGMFGTPAAAPDSAYDHTLYAQTPQSTYSSLLTNPLTPELRSSPQQAAGMYPQPGIAQTQMQTAVPQAAPPAYKESDETANETKAEINSIALRVNSDGTVEGKANDVDVAPTLKADHTNLLNANSDIPGGFQIGNKLNGGNGGGYNSVYNATIDGKQIVIDQNGEGPIKVTVDGKEVKKGEKNGPVDFQDGGPGNCGTVKLTGEDKATGAKIQASISKDIVQDKSTNAGMEILKCVSPVIGYSVEAAHKKWNHMGLTLNVDAANGPNGKPLNLGGALGDALTK